MKARACWLLFFTIAPALASEPVARLDTVVSGLERPVAIGNAGDGSGRLFILELDGRIRIVRDGELLPEPFLDITAKIIREGEGGLVGLAFHPRYSENRHFFVVYTTLLGPDIIWRLSEFRASPEEPDLALPSEKVILQMTRPSTIHHAGGMAFGQDGYLYVASGDGGPGGDPDMRGQDLDTLLGKILRIGVDGPDQPYTIPADNPFVGQQGARGEIWAYGFRNPFRLAFDRLTGRLFVGDVGETRIEEVDLVEKGGNYGWSVLEGTSCYPANILSCDRQRKVPPIHEYLRVDGRAVIGGYVYRGSKLTPLYGAYIFGDFVTGRIWALREVSEGVWQRRDVARGDFLITTFGEDEQGEIYVADMRGGNILRLDFTYQAAFAQVADGTAPTGVLQSVIQLINNQTQDAEGVLVFRNPDGSPRQVTLGEETASEFHISLPPGSARSFTTPGTSEPLFSGWAEFQSNLPVTGSVLYTFTDTDGEVFRAGVAESQKGRGFTVPVARDSALQTNLALAVANPSDTDTAKLRAVITDLQGQVRVDFEVDLAPLWRGAAFIDELGSLPPDFQGTLRLLSDREVAPTLLLTFRGLPSASLPLGN